MLRVNVWLENTSYLKLLLSCKLHQVFLQDFLYFAA